MNWFENQLIPYISGGFLCGITFLLLGLFLPETHYLHGFLFRFWPIQALSTFLFATAIAYFLVRYLYFSNEKKALQKVQVPSTISYEDAQDILEAIPEKLRHTVCFRRLSEILQSFLFKEDVIRLNEELSMRDLDQINRGHLILTSMRNIIPVVGFLGTVIGLSLGMVKFPELVTDTAKIEDLKFILKDFAASLSIAFDTTLLALVYTVIIIIISSILLQKESVLVSDIDEIARNLITQLKSSPTTHTYDEEKMKNWMAGVQNCIQHEIAEAIKVSLKKISEDFIDEIRQYFRQVADQTDVTNKDIVGILKQSYEELAGITGKLDEISATSNSSRVSHETGQSIKDVKINE